MKPSMLFFGVGVLTVILIVVAVLRGSADLPTAAVLFVGAVATTLLGLSLKEEGK